MFVFIPPRFQNRINVAKLDRDDSRCKYSNEYVVAFFSFAQALTVVVVIIFSIYQFGLVSCTATTLVCVIG